MLVAGFIALRVARHWLQERYLPTTTLEPGMQSSLTTLLGYAGGILSAGVDGIKLAEVVARDLCRQEAV